MKRSILMLAANALLIGSAGQAAAGTIVFNTDFNAGVPVQLTGVTTTEGVSGYNNFGPLGNKFTGNYLRNVTVGPPLATTLTLTGLQAHTSVDVNFLLATIDSWDGSTSTSVSPDIFNVRVNGVTVFSKSFAQASGTSDYTPPPGVLLTSGVNLTGNNSFSDAGYNMYLDPTFHNIAHTSSTLTIEWFASGSGWQGGTDESWAIDNVQIVLNTEATVPEPATMTMLCLGIAGMAGYGWRKRKQAAAVLTNGRHV